MNGTSSWPSLPGDPGIVVKQRIVSQQASVKQVVESEGASPTQSTTVEDLGKCSLDALKNEHERVGLLIGVDQKNQQRLKQLNDLHKTQVTKRQRLEEEPEASQRKPGTT